MPTNRVDELKQPDLYVPILEELEAVGGSATNTELIDAVSGSLGLTDEELPLTYARSGAPVFAHKTAFAMTNLRIAGYLKSGGRGVWLLTKEGRAAATGDPEAAKAHVAAAMSDYHRQKREERNAKAAETGTTLDDVELDVEEIGGVENDWDTELLAVIKAIAPDAFERLSRRLLLASGFTNVDVTGKSGDGGIDGHGVLRMNLISFQVLFQCKRYAGSVSAGAVRDFRGAMQGRADKGLIITTGTFTPSAREEAARDGAPTIDLIDGTALCDLLKTLGLGVKVEEIRTEKVTISETFFVDL